MSEYSAPSPFDQTVEKATADGAAEANWGVILEICDRVGQTTTGSKDCLRSVMKRLAHSSKKVQLYAITLLDACVQNCGAPFHKEVATPEFVNEARSFLLQASPNAADKFKEILKKWAENEFKSDSKLSVIPTLYQALRSEGAYFGMSTTSTGTVPLSTAPASSTSTDPELEKAIALSLKESQTKSPTTSLYPQMATLNSQSTHPTASVHNTSPMTTAVQSTSRQVRALYDFEAVEDNELTFTTGELITVLDGSDPNWWKGSTWRGEGLFPVNFVTTDLTLESAGDAGAAKKSVQFNEEVIVEQFDPDSVRIDEKVIDTALDQIQNADPTGLSEDSPEMAHLEDECNVMGPLIDQELEQIDSKHNELMTLNQKLTDAFQLYTRLMKDAANVSQYTAPIGYMPQQQPPPTLPANYMPPQHTAPEATYSYSPAPQETQPQATYYNPGAYGGHPQPMVSQQAQHPQEQQQQPQFNQAAMLQQYQMSGAGLSTLPYIPTATGPMNGLQPAYNTSQASYQ